MKVSVSLEWAQRNQLYKKTGYSFFYSDEESPFTPSIPENDELEDTGFPKHDALTLEANVTHRPEQR